MSKFCPMCGTPMTEGDIFCRSCGYSVNPPAAPAENQPVPPQPPVQPYQSYEQQPPVQQYQPYEQQPVMQQPPVQQYQPYDQQPAMQQPAAQQPTVQAYQAPPAAAPTPPPANPQPKKSKKGLIIGLSIAGVVLVAIAVILIIFGPKWFGKDDSSSSDSSSSEQSQVATEPEEETEAPDTEEETDASVDEDDDFAGEDDIHLTVWASDSAKDVTEEMCREFIAMYPDKTIDIDVNVASEGEASSRVSNEPDSVDVFSFASDQLNELTERNLLLPVDEKFVEGVTRNNTNFTVESAKIDGELYAYPETGENGYYLVYDKRIVSDQDAQTIEGVLKACQKKKKQFVMDAGNGFYSCIFPFTGGLEPTGAAEEGYQLLNNYDEEKVLDSLEAFSKLFQQYSDIFVSGEVGKISSGMASSTVAAGIDGSWNIPAVQAALGENFGAVKLPTINIKGTDTQMISLNGCKLIGVCSHTEYPHAAEELANYLTGNECQMKRLEAVGWAPSNLMALSSDEFKANPALVALIEQSNYAVDQSKIAMLFWSPMGNLGNQLWKENLNRAALKQEFEKTIAQITGE